MYDFLRRPLWMLSHVLVALLILAMIGLGFWQRARWQEVQQQSDMYQSRIDAPAVPLGEVLDPEVTDVGNFPEDLRYRRVVVTGTYDVDAEVGVRNRSQGGAPGAWVLTPLVADDGTAVPVVRGWIPLAIAEGGPPFAGAEPPDGEVTVTGILQPSQERGTFGGEDPASGRLDDLARVDVTRFAAQLDAPVTPAWIQLDGQDPPQVPAAEGASALPAPVAVELRSPWTNISYMVQWWIFAAIAAIGYPLVLRRLARRRAQGGDVPVDSEPPVGARA